MTSGVRGACLFMVTLLLPAFLAALLSVNTKARAPVEYGKKTAVINVPHSLLHTTVQTQLGFKCRAITLASLKIQTLRLKRLASEDSALAGAVAVLDKSFLNVFFKLSTYKFEEQLERWAAASHVLVSTLCDTSLKLIENCTIITQQIKALLLKRLPIFTLLSQ